MTPTMSMAEIERSTLLTGVDVLLFLSSGAVAARYWLEARGRVLELKRLGQEPHALLCRRLLLQLLTLANVLRAIGIVLDLQFHMVLYIGRHRHRMYPWHHWFDYLVSSLPTMVWLSMLSVFYTFITEIHHRSQMTSSPLLRPTIIFLNGASYLIYCTVAFLTMDLSDFPVFRRLTYLHIGCTRGTLAVAMAWRGLRLASQLRRRQDSLLPPQVGGSNFSAQLIVKVRVLSLLLVVTELIRCAFDFSYALKSFQLVEEQKFSKSNIIATLVIEKMLLEWLPSTSLIVAFRPQRGWREDFADGARPSSVGKVCGRPGSRAGGQGAASAPFLTPGSDVDPLASPREGFAVGGAASVSPAFALRGDAALAGPSSVSPGIAHSREAAEVDTREAKHWGFVF